MLQYFNKLKRKWDETLLLRPMSGCRCGAARNCACNAFARISDQDQEDKLIQFLMGLNSCYDHVTNQIPLMDSLPSLDKAYFMICEIEKQSVMGNERAMEMASYLATNYSNVQARSQDSKDRAQGFSKIDKNKLKCDVCKGTRHTRETCFKIVG